MNDTTRWDPVVERLVAARREGRAADTADAARVVATADDAYAVQDAVARRLGWFDDGPARYWKSGGGSRTAVLTHAPLPPAGVRASPADVGDLTLIAPAIEAEVALRLGTAVDAERARSLTLDDARALVDAMAVSIEVVDSRWVGGAVAAPALLRLADLQSHGALVLGEWRPFDAAADWSRQRCELRIGGGEARVFTGTHPLGDPAWLLPTWLRHATRDGATVAAGTVVTTGTWCGLVDVARGDGVEVAFPGIGEARVSI